MVLKPVPVEPVDEAETSEAWLTGPLRIWSSEPIVRVLCNHVVAANCTNFEDLLANRALILAHAIRRAPVSTFAEAPTWLTSPGPDSLKFVHCGCELSHWS